MLQLLLVALLAAWSSPLNPAPLPGDTFASLDVAGVKRTYVLHVPAGINGPVPLVLAFHGHFGTGSEFSRLTGLDALSDSKKFIVAYPDGIDRGWDDGRSLDRGHNDVGMVDALIAELSRRYPIDRSRIYATGFSNGGTFSQYLACVRSTTIAAIGPVAGPLPAVTGAACHPRRAMPVIEMAGTADPLVPYGGGEIHIAGIARGTVWSAPETVAFWAKNARCAHRDATATRTTYDSCVNGTTVELVSVIGGGHTWPGGPQYLPKAIVGLASTQVHASAEIIDFFFAHPLR